MPDANHRVSVIITCYNDGKYIDDAIRSILNQSYKNIEIILVDDGSNDPYTVKKIAGFSDPVISIVRQSHCGGAAARNKGFALSKGEYILVLDGDDKFDATFIERALPILLSESNIAAVSSWARHFGVKNNIKRLTGGVLNDFLFSNNSVACALIKKSIWQEVGGYDETMKGFIDWDFWLKVTKKGYRVFVIQEPLFFYRIKRNSMMSGYLDNEPECLKELYERHIDVLRDNLLDILYKKDQEKKNVQKTFFNSFSYRVGRFITAPLRAVKRAIIRSD